MSFSKEINIIIELFFYQGKEEIYSFSVLTMEAENKFSKIHHRVPGVLESEQDVMV